MKTQKRIFAVLLALALVLLPFSNAFAANGQHITVTSAAPSSDTVVAGQLYRLDLTTCFNDPSGHTLTYEKSGNDLGPHTHIGSDPDNSNKPTFFFTVQHPGNYSVTITATCSGGDSASFVLNLNVTPAQPGVTAQYDYNEESFEDIDEDYITVYVTVSNDGMPIIGQDDDQTELACLPVQLHYFDLDDYGMRQFYRKDSSNQLVERPTLLHLIIYLLERYYLGMDEEDCGQSMSSGIFSYAGDEEVLYLDGTTAYESDGNHALSYSGSPGSFYMTNFWGHNENLMYYRNHMYPLMSDGWGATADYILLDDGDYIDIAMFTDMSFYFGGAFVSFEDTLFHTTTNAALNFEMKKFDTSAMGGISSGLEDMEDSLSFYVYEVDNDGDWGEVLSPSITHNANTNEYSLSISTAGTYYVIATEPGAPYEYASLAPAAMMLTVSTP